MVVTRAMLLAVLLLAGCGGGGGDGASIRLYHLETQVEQIDPREMTADDVVCGRAAVVCPGERFTPAGERSVTENAYRVTGDVALDEDDFVTERAQALIADVTGQPAVTLDVAAHAHERFETFTRNLAWLGQERGVPQHIAIVVGDELVAWPVLDYEQYHDGLEAANGIQIPVATLEDAQRLQSEIRDDER